MFLEIVMTEHFFAKEATNTTNRYQQSASESELSPFAGAQKLRNISHQFAENLLHFEALNMTKRTEESRHQLTI